MSRGKVKPIAMRCSQEQFDGIRKEIVKAKLWIVKVTNFEEYPYLVNNFNDTLGSIANLSERAIDYHRREIFEEWDAETFLRYCKIR